MKRLLIAFAVLVAADATAAPRERSVRLPQRFEPPPAHSRLLWIAAHPDDEVLAAPLLGELCVIRGARCRFLLLTRGEAGECLIEGGCHPDLAFVRAGEMEQSAALFRAEVILWDLPDGTPGGADAALARWFAHAGGEEALLARIGGEISSFNPDLILTFDPRHGSTCHTDHHATGHLAIKAAERVGMLERTHLLENLVTIAPDFSRLTFGTAIESQTVVYDATGTWSFLLASAAVHRSQFDQARLALLSGIAPASRVIRLLPLRLATTLSLGSFCLD